MEKGTDKKTNNNNETTTTNNSNGETMHGASATDQSRNLIHTKTRRRPAGGGRGKRVTKGVRLRQQSLQSIDRVNCAARRK